MADPEDPRKVISPVFGQENGAKVLAGDFSNPKTIEIDIAGTKVTLCHENLFDTGVRGFVIPQWSNKVSDGGIAYAGMQKYGDAFNKAYAQYLAVDTDRDKLARVIMFQDTDNDLAFLHTMTVQTGHLHAAKNVSEAVTYVLMLCESHGIESIGIPAMCTGVQGELEDEQSAKVIAHAIYQYSQTKPMSTEITVAISGYGANDRFKAFSHVFQNPHLFENFDPVAEVGTRPEDIRRMIAEKSEQGKLPVVVVGKDGDILTAQPKTGATVHTLHGEKPPRFD